MNIPKSWALLDKANYEYLNIEESENIKCLATYVVESEGGALVNFFNYIGFDKAFLQKIDSAYKDLNEENSLIDGDPQSPTYKNTALYACIYNKFTTIKETDAYVNISRVPDFADKDGFVYCVQIYMIAESGLISAQVTVRDIDEENIEEFLNSDLMQNVIQYLLENKN